MDTLRIFTIVGVLLLASHPSGFTGVDGAAVPQNTTSTALPEAVIPTVKEGGDNAMATKETVKPKDSEGAKPVSDPSADDQGEALDSPTAIPKAKPKPESGDDDAPEPEVTTGSEQPTEPGSQGEAPQAAPAPGNETRTRSAKNETLDGTKPVAIATDDEKVSTEGNVPSERGAPSAEPEAPSAEPKVKPIDDPKPSTDGNLLIEKNETDVSSSKNTTKPTLIVVPTVESGLVNGVITDGEGVKHENNKTEEVPIPPLPPVVNTTSIPTTTTTMPTTTPTTTTTTTTVAPVDVVTKVAPPVAITVVPSVPAVATDPPYVVVTSTTAAPSAATNASLVVGAKTDDKAAPFSPKLIAIIVGSAVGLIVVIVIIIIVIVCMRKRHSGVKKREIPIVENPRYVSANSQQGHNYRFSRDASLMIGAPHLANNNLNKEGDMNSLRKKRKAPPPPNPFTGEVDAFSNPLRQDSVEYYEKDTPHGSEVELTTFGVKQQPQVDDRKHTAPAKPPRLADDAQTDFTDDDDDDDAHRSMEELEGRALLDDIERETGYKLEGDGAGNRKSVADKYRFSDDEEARDSRDYNRKYSLGDNRFSSEEELDNPQEGLHYDVNDITDELPPTPEGSGDEAGNDKKKNPFES